MRPGAGEVGGSGRGRRKPGPAATRPALLLLPPLLLLAATAPGAAGGAADVGRGFLGPGGEGEEGGWGPPAEAAALPDFGAGATRVLEAAFARNPQPMLQELQAIAAEAGATAKQAPQWFHSKQ